MLILFGGAFLGAVIAQLDPHAWFQDPMNWASLAISAGLGLGGLALETITEHLTSKRLEKIKETTATTLRDFIDPLAQTQSHIHTLVASAQSEGDIMTYLKGIASTGSSIFPGGGFRVCIYRFDSPEDESRPASANDPAMLTLRAFAGRVDAPRYVWNSNTPAGQEFIKAARMNTPTCHNDATKATDIIDRNEGTKWKAFMIVPVRLNGTRYGAVSIDVTRLTVFDEPLQQIGEFIALHVASGEVLGKAGARDPGPEADEARRRLEALSED